MQTLSDYVKLKVLVLSAGPRPPRAPRCSLPQHWLPACFWLSLPSPPDCEPPGSVPVPLYQVPLLPNCRPADPPVQPPATVRRSRSVDSGLCSSRSGTWRAVLGLGLGLSLSNPPFKACSPSPQADLHPAAGAWLSASAEASGHQAHLWPSWVLEEPL